MTDAQQQVLQKQLDKIAKEHKYVNYETKITPISSEGANFTSVLFLATISAANEDDLNLFAKVSAIGEKLRQQMFVQIFDVENYAYNTLAKIYDGLQERYNVPEEHRFRMPKFYVFDDTYLEEVLVLQDLSADGFTTHDRFKSMDWEYASRSLEELAKYHALSFVFQEDYPEEFEKATKVFKLQSAEDNKKMAEAMVRVSANTVQSITDEKHKEKLSKFLEKAGNWDYMSQFLVPMKRPVLTHGDFRMSNVMHKAGKDKLEVVFVDYQLVHLGCGIRDMLYFLISGTDGEFREKNFFPLIEHYYKQMGVTLKRFGRDLETVYPRKDFDYEVQMNLPWALVVGMFVLPIITVASENAPQVNDDFDMESITSIQTNTLYETRINDVIRDFANWGVI